MRPTSKAAIRQLFLFVAATVVAFTILVRTEVVSRFAYLVEKGRLRAIRETLPSQTELDHWNARARAVAAAVAPAVVQIVTERRFDLSAGSQMEILRDLMEIGEGEEADRLRDMVSNGIPLPDDETHRRFRQNGELRIRDGYGSGFIVDGDKGYIVTNSHVIEHADAIHVQLADGRRFEADLLGADRKSDLAVIQVVADNLHELALADSGVVEVGDDVMAVGNPFGLDGTFSRGIISAKKRSSIDIHGIEYKGFLQTDAVINPGNSGGPLVNMRGEVIAINTAIATESGHYDGVGFAIPSRRIIRLLPVLARGGEVVRGFLGVSIVSAADRRELSADLGWEGYSGAIVTSVLADSPAATAGLKQGDVVLAIDDEELRNTADLIDLIGETAPETEVILRIWRDQRETSIGVRIERQPDNFSTRVRRPALPD